MTLADAVTPLQSRGQHNPRHFALRAVALPFPRYDASDSIHSSLSQLGERAEALVAGLEFGATVQFQKARRMTREALVESGVAGEIDAAVKAVLADSADTGDVGLNEATVAPALTDLARRLSHSQASPGRGWVVAADVGAFEGRAEKVAPGSRYRS